MMVPRGELSLVLHAIDNVKDSVTAMDMFVLKLLLYQDNLDFIFAVAMKDGDAAETVTDVVKKFIRIKLFTQQFQQTTESQSAGLNGSGPVIRLKSALANQEESVADDITTAEADHAIDQMLTDYLVSNLSG